MSKRPLPKPDNYLKLSMQLKATLMSIKEEAKAATGRAFGTHAERGSAEYEVLIRNTLDEAIRIVDGDKFLDKEEKDIIRRRLKHDYEYGYAMREKDRQIVEAKLTTEKFVKFRRNKTTSS